MRIAAARHTAPFLDTLAATLLRTDIQATVITACSAVALGIGLGGCAAPTAAVKDEPAPAALAIDLGVAGRGQALVAHCAARNVSGAPVHVFDSPRMPYLIDERGTLVVLHGVSRPPESADLNAIEIPATRALAPGEVFAFDVPLVPVRLRGHYGSEPTGSAPRGVTPIVCRVAHGATPLDAAARAHATISTLLAWQHFESSQTLVVRLP